MYQNIIILSQPRTGSTLICDLFNYFSEIRVLQEFFNMKDITAYRYLKAIEKNLFLSRFKAEDCNSLNHNMKQNSFEAFTALNEFIPSHRVLKFHTYEIENWNLEFLFNDPNTKFILLSRKDKLKQFVSNQLAKVSNKYSTRDPEHEIYNSINLVVDPDEFNKYKNDSDLHYKKYKEKLAGHNYLELVYEDDVENDLEVTIEKIDKWLKDNDIIVERKPYNLIYQKQNTRSLADTIVNYSDITK